MTELEVKIANSPESISRCWPAMHALRPSCPEHTFAETIQRLMKRGYQLVFLEYDGKVVAVAGFETGEKLHRGRYLYIDDLSTLPEYRGRGLGSRLLEWIFEFAGKQGIQQIHLDSGVQRFDAHRLYLKKGFNITSHHFCYKMNET